MKTIHTRLDSNSPATDSREVPGVVPVAVVGVSCLFPGSSTKEGYWRDILAGRNMVGEVPSNYFQLEDFYDPDPFKPDKTYCKTGAYLSPVEFDPMEFGVPPTNLAQTDTSQLLGMLVARQVLEDAFRNQFSSMDKSRMSCILGVAAGLELLGEMAGRLGYPVWLKALREEGVPEDEAQRIVQRIIDHSTPWKESTFPGLLGNVVSGRIANKFDLGGTNCTSDAACASSFSAMSQALNELYLGQSDVVISGGVDTNNDPFLYICFSKTPALSLTGDCRPFSDKADGMVLGEGMGMVALKRLEDAERDGDRIYAVIRGMGSSSDGSGTSVYAPVPEGQAKALRRAYQNAGYGPETVELMEAHGTGTFVGDAVEFKGLQTVFGESGRSDKQWCALGSVKSQIGHTKSAAAVASLIKSVLALHHKMLPPTIKVDKPDPKLGVEDSPFYINAKVRPWIQNGHPRRASISSFGFGGTNFHATLEEYTGSGKRAYRQRVTPDELILFCADSPEGLADQCADAVREISLDGVFSWIARRGQETWEAGKSCKLAILAKDGADLEQKIDAALARIQKDPGEDFSLPTGIFYSKGKTSGEPLAFLFPGQGSQYLDMGRELFSHFDEVQEVWDEAHRIFSAEGVDLGQVVFPKPTFTDEDRDACTKTLTETQWAQPGICLTSIAMARILNRIGLQSAATGGHSLGELTALHQAGVMNLESVLRATRKRGEIMAASAPVPGTMTSVAESPAKIEALLKEWGSEAIIANYNSPQQVVLSGPTAAIEDAEKRLEQAGIRAQRLNVSTAFHSSLMDEACTPFRSFLDGVTISKPSIPVYANAEAGLYPEEDDAIRALLTKQLNHSVRFVEQIEAMYAAGIRTFVEVGPGNVLTGLVKRILGDKPHRVIPLDQQKGHGLSTLWKALAELAVAGHPMDLKPLWERFEDHEDPRNKKKPKFTVSLQGCNYQRRYPVPRDQYPAPNPPRSAQTPAASPAKPVAKAAPAPAPAPKKPAKAAATAPTSSSSSSSARATAPAPAAAPSPAPAPAGSTTQAGVKAQAPAGPKTAPAAAAGPAGTVNRNPASASHSTRSSSLSNINPSRGGASIPMSNSNKSTHPEMVDLERWLTAFQEIQRQVEEPHALFQKTMAESHIAYLNAVESNNHTLAALLQGGVTVTATPLPEHTPPETISAAAVPTTPAQPPAQPVVTSEPAGFAAPSAPASASASASVPAPAPVAAAAPAAAAAAHAVPDDIDFKEMLLDIVADKTGYPKDILSMEMGLEEDLGIDSIKRVEILSSIKDQNPWIPEVDPAEMANIQTLGDVHQFMEDFASKMRAQGSPATPAAAPVAASPAPAEVAAITPLPTTAPAAAGPEVVIPENINFQEMLLDIVADKTGYPKDILNLEMGLEADLGIDSIKRVEILSAVKDENPWIPEVDPAEMANIVTLGDVVTFMENFAEKVKSGEVQALPAGAPAASASPAAPADTAPMAFGPGGGAPVAAQAMAAAPALMPTSGIAADTGSAAAPVAYMTEGSQALAAQPVAGAVEIPDNINFEEMLLNIVADKTGYPKDILNLDMGLESDLGIDSIKRVEILSAIKDENPWIPEVDPAEMANIHTLGDVLKFMEDFAANAKKKGGVNDGNTAAATPAAASGTPLHRLALHRVAAPRSGFAMQRFRPGSTVAITDDGTGIAPALQNMLNAQGLQASVVQVVPEICDILIYLGGLKNVNSPEEAIAINREAFLAAKSIAPAFSSKGGVFITVQDTDGDFGLGGQTGDRVWLSGLPGLVKSAAIEWQNTMVKAIDLQRGSRQPDELARALFEEFISGGPEIEVCLPADGSRYRLESRPATVSTDKAPINKDSVILASGGARGVTAVTLIELARRYQPRMVLLGRTPLQAESEATLGAKTDAELKKVLMETARAEGRPIKPADLGRESKRILACREILATLGALKDAGSEARYLVIDVLDSAALSKALESIREEWGPVTGIVHGAGVLNDKLIIDKTPEQFDPVFNTKIGGLRSLLAATAPDPLNNICLFSSVAGRYGNMGQCDYAMANEILNKVANQEAARRPDCIVKAINWGPWDGGMVSPLLKTHFEKMGIPLIPYEEGARIMAEELSEAPGASTEIVIGPKPPTPALLNHAVRPDVSHALHIDAGRYPYFNSHVIDENPVLPVVMALEWFSRSAILRRPDKKLTSVGDLKVLRGIKLANLQEGEHMTVRSTGQADAEQPEFRMEFLNGNRDLPGYTATAGMSDTPQRDQGHRSPASQGSPDSWTLDVSDIYKDHLFHGPDFHVIDTLEGVSENSAAAILKGTKMMNWPGELWVTDAAAIDGALQLAILWGIQQTGKKSLPTRIGTYLSYSDQLTDGPVRCELQGSIGNDKSVSDIALFDQNGQLLAELKGVEMHMLPAKN